MTRPRTMAATVVSEVAEGVPRVGITGAEETEALAVAVALRPKIPLARADLEEVEEQASQQAATGLEDLVQETASIPWLEEFSVSVAEASVPVVRFLSCQARASRLLEDLFPTTPWLEALPSTTRARTLLATEVRHMVPICFLGRTSPSASQAGKVCRSTASAAPATSPMRTWRATPAIRTPKAALSRPAPARSCSRDRVTTPALRRSIPARSRSRPARLSRARRS
jgi:hypothetical protein